MRKIIVFILLAVAVTGCEKDVLGTQVSLHHVQTDVVISGEEMTKLGLLAGYKDEIYIYSATSLHLIVTVNDINFHQNTLEQIGDDLYKYTVYRLPTTKTYTVDFENNASSYRYIFKSTK